MTYSSSSIEQLGCNSTEYTQAMSSEQETAEFDWASEKIKLLIAALKSIPSRDRVADIGCRTGGQAAYYQAQAEIQEMHGFEIGPSPLIEAKKKGLQVHEWISGISACPVENNFFDVIIAGDLIEHLLDTDVFLEELVRVVKPGGYLLITTPNLAWWWNRWRLVTGKVPGNMGSVSFNHAADVAVDKKHLRVSVNSEWQYLFEQHGLDLVETQGYFYPKLLRSPLNLLDGWMAQNSETAHSNLFVLRKPS